MRAAPSLSAVCDVGKLELSRVYDLAFAGLVVTIPAAHTIAKRQFADSFRLLGLIWGKQSLLLI